MCSSLKAVIHEAVLVPLGCRHVLCKLFFCSRCHTWYDLLCVTLSRMLEFIPLWRHVVYDAKRSVITLYVLHTWGFTVMTSSCMIRNYLLSWCPICLNLSLNLSFYAVVYDAKIFVETLVPLSRWRVWCNTRHWDAALCTVSVQSMVAYNAIYVTL